MGTKTVGRFVTDVATPINVAADSNITFSSNTISTGAITYNSPTGEIQIMVPGLYMIYANFTAVATAAGVVGVQMLENGVQVPGAKAFETLAAVGDNGSLSFNAVTTVKCSSPNNFATISFRNVNATSYSVANVIIEKIA